MTQIRRVMRHTTTAAKIVTVNAFIMLSWEIFRRKAVGPVGGERQSF